VADSSCVPSRLESWSEAVRGLHESHAVTCNFSELLATAPEKVGDGLPREEPGRNTWVWRKLDAQGPIERARPRPVRPESLHAAAWLTPALLPQVRASPVI
jgi:hypothetical protein